MLIEAQPSCSDALSKAMSPRLPKLTHGSRRGITCSPSAPRCGHTHLLAGIGHVLVDRGYRVLFTRTSQVVQRQPAARRDLRLPCELAKLDRFDLLILDALRHGPAGQAGTLGPV
jgi:hypothetical protein